MLLRFALPFSLASLAALTSIFLNGVPLSAQTEPPIEFTTITTIAGNGESGEPRNGPALKTAISNPFGIHPLTSGGLVIVSYDRHVLFELDPAAESLEILAGTGASGLNTEDGLPATQVPMNGPHEIQVDSSGHVYVADTMNHRVGRIDAQTKRWTTMAGTGKPGFHGDDGPADQARFNQAYSIALDGHLLFVADLQNHRVRQVDLKTGTIQTICGTGEKKLPRDGESAITQPLAGPRSLAVDPDHLWIVLREGNSVWRIDRQKGTIHHVAGTGKKGFTGDGGPARQATLSGPKGIAVEPGKAIFIADTENHAIRQVDLRSGIMSTVVGASGKKGFDRDGPDPRNRQLARPHGVFLMPNGDLLIGDSENHRVRKLVRQR